MSNWYQYRPIIHVQGQMCEHDDVVIQANIKGIIELRDALNRFISGAAPLDVKLVSIIWGSDGESYQLKLVGMADPEHDEPIDHYWMYQAERECQNRKDGRCIAERRDA